MSPEKGILVTVKDLETGETDSRVIWNDYVVVAVGDHYMDNTQIHSNGTVVVTIKRNRGDGKVRGDYLCRRLNMNSCLGPEGSHDVHFNRSVCACGFNRSYCEECGRQTDYCVTEQT
jgi:hypothetical protein